MRKHHVEVFVIYQLIRRDRILWTLTLALCAGFAVADWLGFAGSILFAIILLLLIVNWKGTGQRCTIFEASLPIGGRSLFFARLVSNLILIWAPLLVIFATSPIPSHMTRRDADIFFVEVGATLTLGIFCIQSARIRQFAPPLWWQSSVVAAAGLALVYDDELSDRTTLLICALGCCVLFLRIAALIPRSLQIAPEHPVPEETSEGMRRLPAFAWLPLARALFPPYSAVTFGALIFLGATGAPFLGSIVAITSISGDAWRMRNENRWLLAEPLPRAPLFGLIVGVPLFSYLAGCFLQPHFVHETVRTVVVGFMIVGSFSLSPSILAAVFLLWRRAPLFWVRLFLLAMLIATFEVIVHFFWANDARGLYSRTPPIERMLNGVLPAQMPLLVATVGVTLALLFWLAYEISFRRLEVLPRLQADASNSRLRLGRFSPFR